MRPLSLAFLAVGPLLAFACSALPVERAAPDATGSGAADSGAVLAVAPIEAGVDAGTVDASDGDARLALRAAVGTVDGGCAEAGALACAGRDQKQQLRCSSDHRWVPNGTCTAPTNCDALADTQTTGTCQPIDPECVARTPLVRWCRSADAPQWCNEDRFLRSGACVSPKICHEGACVDCTPGTRVCNEPGKMTICSGAGVWETFECPSATSLCHEGACVECIPDGGVQCIHRSYWEGTARCSNLGYASEYVGRCAAGERCVAGAGCQRTP